MLKFCHKTKIRGSAIQPRTHALPCVDQLGELPTEEEDEKGGMTVSFFLQDFIAGCSEEPQEI